MSPSVRQEQEDEQHAEVNNHAGATGGATGEPLDTTKGASHCEILTL